MRVNEVVARGYVQLLAWPALRQSRNLKDPTVFVNGEGHIGGDNLIVADLAELEGAVGVDCLHLQDAVVLLPFNHRGFVGLLLEHRRVLIDVVHLDVHSGPDGDKIFHCQI